MDLETGAVVVVLKKETEFMLSMSFSQSSELRQSLRQEPRLSLEQRGQVNCRLLTLRLALLRELRDEKYEPKATCPSCRRELTPVEIIRGFNQNPSDFTTGCSACGHRFQPMLVCFGKGSRLELPFFCSAQVLPQLRHLSTLPPEELAREHPAIYRSAIVHHGGIKATFEKLGIQYQFEEISDWSHKITSFLGRLPDLVIAKCVGVSVGIIRKRRRKLGVSRFSRRKLLAEPEVKA